MKMTAKPSDTNLQGQTCVTQTIIQDDRSYADNLLDHEDKDSFSSEPLSILSCFASVELARYGLTDDVCDKVMSLQADITHSNDLQAQSFIVSNNDILTHRQDSYSNLHIIHDNVTTVNDCEEDSIIQNLDASFPEFIRSVPSPRFLTELDGSSQDKNISLNHSLADLNSNSEELLLAFSVCENDDLYLECTDDLHYLVPDTATVAIGHSIVAKNINFKISFNDSITNDDTGTENNFEINRYHCPLCTRTFANENWMKQHFVDRHKQSARFNCNLCSFTTHSNRNLIRHVRRQHLTTTKSKCQSSFSKPSRVNRGIDALLDNNSPGQTPALPLTDTCSKSMFQTAPSCAHCYESIPRSSDIYPFPKYLDASPCTYNRNTNYAEKVVTICASPSQTLTTGMQASDIKPIIFRKCAGSASPADLLLSLSTDKHMNPHVSHPGHTTDSLPVQIPLYNRQKCTVDRTALKNIGVTGQAKTTETNVNNIGNIIEDSVTEISNSPDTCNHQDMSNSRQKLVTHLITQSESNIVQSQKDDGAVNVALSVELHNQLEGHQQLSFCASTCEQCHKQFSTKSCLQRHIMRFHMNGLKKAFKCDEKSCGKAFNLRTNLTAHKNKVHKRKLRLMLASCTARQKHLPSNSRMLPDSGKIRNYSSQSGKFQCSRKNCGKTFRDKYSLDEHECIHSGKMLRKCLLCNYECIQKSSLNLHIATYHANCTSVVPAKNLDYDVSEALTRDSGLLSEGGNYATKLLFVECYVKDDYG